MHGRPFLKRLAESLWVAERPQTFYGLPVGTRMTVIRLAGDRLILHSPVTLDPPLRAELDALERVCFAVAPNRLHHLYAGDACRSRPRPEEPATYLGYFRTFLGWLRRRGEIPEFPHVRLEEHEPSRAATSSRSWCARRAARR